MRGDGGACILVVEDNAELRSYLAEAVRLLGYNVTTAESGDLALELLARNQPQIDLVLTDVVMPGMTGRELGERAGKMRPDLKVIYLTGYSHRALARDGRLDPRLNVLQKPVTQNELAARIREVLEAPDGRSRRQTKE